jgi:uncharacterized protein (TIGR01244 family)
MSIRIFTGSIVTGLALVLAWAAYTHMTDRRALTVVSLTGDIAVTEQLQPEAMEVVDKRGYRTVIDLRPDGEAADQPSSKTMSLAAKKAGVGFIYVPVQHGDIPDHAVRQLAAALESAPRPILMYCRSGRRAARTWSLVEASRPNGLPAPAIMQAVHEANQSADDLQEAIAQRIKARSAAAGGT